MNLVASSAIAQDFAERILRGERVRCGLIVGGGGSGKSVLAESLVEELSAKGHVASLVPGDLSPVLGDLGKPTVLIVDAADQSPTEFLDGLRAEALAPASERSVLLLARSSTASPAIAELAVLAERDGMFGQLATLTADDVATRIPTNSKLTAEDIAVCTGGVPLHVDRLCSGWDEEGWPDSIDAMRVDDLPRRFVDAINMRVALLAPADRQHFAKLSIARLAAIDCGDPRRARTLIDAGMATLEGDIPLAVALAARATLRHEELNAASQEIGLTLLETDPVQAADLFAAADTPHAWLAVALAAAGQLDHATAALDASFGSGVRDGAVLAAAAHVAASEARYADAARLTTEISDHPYWSEEKVAAVKRLHALLDLQVEGSVDQAEAVVEPGAAMLSEAVSVLRSTLHDDDPNAPAVGVRLRKLLRQSANQRPTLDLFISASELASIAALLVGEFEVARHLVERSPEVADRSSLSRTLHDWIAIRSGRAVESARIEVEHSVGALPNVLELATQIMATRRSGDTQHHRDLAESIVSLGASMSVDLLTFDAFCELHLGAQRLDARPEAQVIADGLDAFVERIGSPRVWEARLLWNRVEAAVAGGDISAVELATGALCALTDVGRHLSVLQDAARQWVAVLDETIDIEALGAVLNDLEQHGFLWEAAALAGQAAIRSKDGDVTRDLLQRGREFRQSAPQAKVTSPAGLTEREIEIGQLVLAGHSYKEIGATCFISPKTVEHHVAHIRQKLVAVGVSRAEFRAALEADLRPQDSTAS